MAATGPAVARALVAVDSGALVASEMARVVVLRVVGIPRGPALRAVVATETMPGPRTGAVSPAPVVTTRVAGIPSEVSSPVVTTAPQVATAADPAATTARVAVTVATTVLVAATGVGTTETTARLVATAVELAATTAPAVAGTTALQAVVAVTTVMTAPVVTAVGSVAMTVPVVAIVVASAGVTVRRVMTGVATTATTGPHAMIVAARAMSARRGTTVVGTAGTRGLLGMTGVVTTATTAGPLGVLMDLLAMTVVGSTAIRGLLVMTGVRGVVSGRLVMIGAVRLVGSGGTTAATAGGISDRLGTTGAAYGAALAVRGRRVVSVVRSSGTIVTPAVRAVDVTTVVVDRVGMTKRRSARVATTR